MSEFFDYLESVGQTNIFDFLEETETPPPKRVKEFKEGERVKIRFYKDELPYVENILPNMLDIGVVVDRKFDFYSVDINGEIIELPGEKLILVGGK